MGQCNKMLEEMSFNALFQKLPVGIEVYDERGQLVDLNRALKLISSSILLHCPIVILNYRGNEL